MRPKESSGVKGESKKVRKGVIIGSQDGESSSFTRSGSGIQFTRYGNLRETREVISIYSF